MKGRSSKRLQSKKKATSRDDDDDANVVPEEEEEEEPSVIDEVLQGGAGKGKRRVFLVAFKDQPESARRWEPRVYIEQKGPQAAALLSAFEEAEKKKGKTERTKPAAKRAPPTKRAKKATPEEDGEFPEEDEEFELAAAEEEASAGEDSDSEVEVEVVAPKRRRGRPRKDAEEDEVVVVDKRQKRAKKSVAKKEPPAPKTRLEMHFQVPMWRMGQVATLLHVPHDVMKSRLLPFLGWSDVRSLSRVCTALREDALLHMTKLAKAKFGAVVRSEDSTELNLAMACLTALGDQVFSKAQAMREFCISDAVARNMQQGAVLRGRRMLFLPEQVITASLQRHRTLTAMLAYKNRLNNNRNMKAELRAQAPERMKQLNEALLAIGTTWSDIHYVVDGYYAANRWIKNGTGNAKLCIEGLVKGVQKRNRELARRAELHAACLTRGIEMPDNSRSVYHNYLIDTDDLDAELNAYAISDTTLEEGMALVMAVVEKRNRRRTHVTDLVAQLGFSWEQVVAVRTSSSNDHSNRWGRHNSAANHADLNLQRYVRHGDVLYGVRAVEAAILKRVCDVLGPQAEEAVREGKLGEGFDVSLLTHGLFRSVLVLVQAHRDIGARAFPELNRGRPMFAAAQEPDAALEAMSARGENPLTQFASLEYPSAEEVLQLVVEQLAARKVRADEAFAIADTACSIRAVTMHHNSLVPVSSFIENERQGRDSLEHSAKAMRKQVQTCDDLMREMMELSGEDYATLAHDNANLQGAALAAVTLGDFDATGLMADVLLRGVEWHRASSLRKKTKKKTSAADALMVEVEAFTAKYPNEWTRSIKPGLPQDWHADAVGRAHLLRLPQLSDDLKEQFTSAHRSLQLLNFGWTTFFPNRAEHDEPDLTKYFGEPFSAVSCNFNPATPFQARKRSLRITPFFPTITPFNDGSSLRATVPFVTYPRDLEEEEGREERESSSEDVFANRDDYGGGYHGYGYGGGYDDDDSSPGSDEFFNYIFLRQAMQHYYD